jgi:hypothetical protein
MKNIIAGIMLVVSVSNAQDYTLDSYKKAYEQKQQALAAQYGKDLDAGLLDLKKKGDFDNYLILEAEKKRFDAEKRVMDLAAAKEPYRSATIAYGQALVNLQEQYIKALDEQVKKNLIANRIEEAKAAKAAKDEVAASLAGLKEALPAQPLKPVAVAAEPAPEKPALLGSLFTTYSKDLVLYYTFDKNMGSSVADTSKNKNEGRLLGAKWLPVGKVGGASVFNGGTDRILIDHDASLELGSGPRTMGAWIKSYGSTHTYQSIFCKGSNPGYSLRLGRFPDRAIEYFKSGGQDATFYTSSQTISDSDWHHIVVVDQGSGTVEFYMDGAFLEATTKQNYNSNTKEKAAVGGLANTNHGQWFNGNIDELFIFKRALTKTEVKRLYDAQSKK